MPIDPKELHGEWVGNGCCSTPACYRMRIGPDPMCGSANVCIYPGICGCGPSCPEPCGASFQPCPMMGEDVYCNCGNCIKFKDASTLEPLCCGCGMGYVKKGGAPPVANEMMER